MKQSSNPPSLAFAVRRATEITDIMESLAQDLPGTATNEIDALKGDLKNGAEERHPVTSALLQHIENAAATLATRSNGDYRGAMIGTSTHLWRVAEAIEKWLLQELSERGIS